MFISVSLALPSSSSPSSVGISVGGVSLDLRRLMLTAANLLRPTTKQAGDKLFPPEAERKESAVWDGSTLGDLLWRQPEMRKMWNPFPDRTHLRKYEGAELPTL